MVKEREPTRRRKRRKIATAIFAAQLKTSVHEIKTVIMPKKNGIRKIQKCQNRIQDLVNSNNFQRYC